MARAVSKEKGRPYFYIYIILWAISPVKNGLTNFRVFVVDASTVLYARALNKPLIHVVGDSHVVPLGGVCRFWHITSAQLQHTI